MPAAFSSGHRRVRNAVFLLGAKETRGAMLSSLRSKACGLSMPSILRGRLRRKPERTRFSSRHGTRRLYDLHIVADRSINLQQFYGCAVHFDEGDDHAAAWTVGLDDDLLSPDCRFK